MSVYVGQVDYSATPEELLSHFEACGTVERITIVCDKATGRPKGTSFLLLVLWQFLFRIVKENTCTLDSYFYVKPGKLIPP
jgi:RNA recognition motif. (a.k.a. RRM, RBD, or RNP domain)